MTYERITEDPQFDGPVRDSHEIRYRIAAGFVEPGDIVLDVGCGVGYGAEILSRCPKVEYCGIDKNPPKTSTKKKRFLKIDLEEEYAVYGIPVIIQHDIFVALEIIEHLSDFGVSNLVSMAKMGARKWIIVSTPIVPNSNPYHIQQFNEGQIIDLFVDKSWRHYGTVIQRGIYGIFIFKSK